MSRLKVVFFDVDDTLYSTSQFADKARRNAIRAMMELGLHMEEADLVRELEEVINEFTSNYQHHFEKLLLRIGEDKYRGVNPAILVAAAVRAYHDTKSTGLKPFPDVEPALQALAHSDLRLGVITMGPQIKQAEKLLRLDVVRYLDPMGVFISDQIGIGKPNAKLYMKACQGMGVWPAEAMYVGDNAPNDIDPPNELGMATVLVNREGKYAEAKGQTEPDHIIESFDQLLKILQGDYGTVLRVLP